MLSSLHVNGAAVEKPYIESQRLPLPCPIPKHLPCRNFLLKHFAFYKIFPISVEVLCLCPRCHSVFIKELVMEQFKSSHLFPGKAFNEQQNKGNPQWVIQSHFSKGSSSLMPEGNSLESYRLQDKC